MTPTATPTPKIPSHPCPPTISPKANKTKQNHPTSNIQHPRTKNPPTKVVITQTTTKPPCAVLVRCGPRDVSAVFNGPCAVLQVSAGGD
ncbi:hypothetical protein BDR22DRAFT_847185 [Usnea florida]